MFLLAIAILFILYAFFIFFIDVLISLLTTLLTLFTTVPSSYQSNSTIIAVSLALVLIGAAAVKRQPEMMNTISAVYECYIYPALYGATNDDYGGFAWAILGRDLYKWIAPKYNAVVRYVISGAETAAIQIISVIPVNPLNFSDVWTSICALWDFGIHLFRTFHSSEVPEIEIPNFTDPVLNFIIDAGTCWLRFFKNFFYSLSEVFFLGTCGPECTALSTNACECTKLTSEIFAFVPVNGAIYQPFIDDAVDVVCCLLELVITIGKSLAGGTFLDDVDTLIIQGIGCLKLYFRVWTGDSYTGGYFRPVTDGFADLVGCWLVFAAHVGKALIDQLLFGAPTFDSLLDGLWDEFTDCFCDSLDYFTGGTIVGLFSQIILEFCEVVRCFGHWVISVFRVFRDGTLLAQGPTLITDFATCFNLYLNWLFSSATVGGFFNATASFIVIIVRDVAILLFNLFRLTLEGGTLSGDIATRINDFVAVIATFLDGITGGGPFGASPFTTFINDTAAVFGLFLIFAFDLMESIVQLTFFGDLLTNVGQFFDFVVGLATLVTGNFWPGAIPAVVDIAECYTNGVFRAVDGAQNASFTGFFDFFTSLCSCNELWIRLIMPPGMGAWGNDIAQYQSCMCFTMRDILLSFAQNNFITKDCSICSDLSLDCTNCHTFTEDLASCNCEFFGDIYESATSAAIADGAVLGDAIKDGCYALTCFVHIYKKGLAAGYLLLTGDAAGASTIGLDLINPLGGGIFHCASLMLEWLSGGVFNDMFDWLIQELFSALGDLIDIVLCFANPAFIDSLNTYLFAWSGPGTFDIGSGHCDLSSTWMTLSTCLANPANGLLEPLVTVGFGFLNVDPLFNIVNIPITYLDLVVCCPHDALSNILNTGSCGNGNCLTCPSGQTLGSYDTDWGALGTIFDVGDTFNLFTDILPFPGSFTSLQVPVNAICCVRDVVACYAGSAQQIAGGGAYVAGPMAEVGSFLLEFFDLSVDFLCSIAGFIDWVLSIVGSIEDFIMNITSELDIILGFISDLTVLLNDTIGTLNTLIGTVTNVINKVNQIIGLVFGGNSIGDVIDQICEALEAFDISISGVPGLDFDLSFDRANLCSSGIDFSSGPGTLKRSNLGPKDRSPLHDISSACNFFYNHTAVMPMVNAFSPTLVKSEGSLPHDKLLACATVMGGMEVDRYTNEPLDMMTQEQIDGYERDFITAERVSTHLWNSTQALNYTNECIEKMNISSIEDVTAPIMIYPIAECIWEHGLQQSQLLQGEKFTFSRCMLLLTQLSPATNQYAYLNFDTTETEYNTYKVCYAYATLEETDARKEGDAYIKKALPDVSNPTSIMSYALSVFTTNELVSHNDKFEEMKSSGFNAKNISDFMMFVMNTDADRYQEILDMKKDKTPAEFLVAIYNFYNYEDVDAYNEEQRVEADAKFQDRLDGMEQGRKDRAEYEAVLDAKIQAMNDRIANTNKIVMDRIEHIKRDPSAYKLYFGNNPYIDDLETRGVNISDAEEVMGTMFNDVKEYVNTIQGEEGIKRLAEQKQRRADLTARVKKEREKIAADAELRIQERMERGGFQTEVFSSFIKNAKKSWELHVDAYYDLVEKSGRNIERHEEKKSKRSVPDMDTQPIMEYLEYSEAAQEGRVFWSQDEDEHFVYGVIDDPQEAEKFQLYLAENGTAPRFFVESETRAHNYQNQTHEHRRFARFVREGKTEIPDASEHIKKRMESTRSNIVDEFNRREISGHLSTIGSFIYNATTGTDWRKVVRLANRNVDGYRPEDDDTGYFFFFTVDKKAWKKMPSVISRYMKPKPIISELIDPTGENKAPFNLNTHMNYIIDKLFELLNFEPEFFTEILDTIADQPVEEHIENLVTYIIDGVVCNRPADYDGTNPFKITCAPNIYEDLFDWIQVVPTKAVPRQFPWAEGLLQPGSCVQVNNRPNSNCGVPDGGSRPFCAGIPSPIGEIKPLVSLIKCDFCEMDYKDCRSDIGFEDVGDTLAFSIAAIPRVVDVILHPNQNLGIFGDPVIYVIFAVIAPSYLQFIVYIFMGSSMFMMAGLAILFPGIEKIALVFSLSTQFVDYPTVKFTIIKPLINFVETTLSFDLKFFWIPESVLEYILAKLNRVNYEEPWFTIPTVDTTCYIWTAAYNLFSFILLFLLVLQFIAPILAFFKDIIKAFFKLISNIVSALNMARNSSMGNEIHQNSMMTHHNKAETTQLENRLRKIEERISPSSVTIYAEQRKKENTYITKAKQNTKKRKSSAKPKFTSNVASTSNV